MARAPRADGSTRRSVHECPPALNCRCYHPAAAHPGNVAPVAVVQPFCGLVGGMVPCSTLRPVRHDFVDRVALVTGSKRIGAVIARRFAEAGADMALAYNRSREEAEAAARRIRALGRRAVARAGRRVRVRRTARVSSIQRSQRARPARRAGEHGVALSRAAVRRTDGRRTGTLQLDVDLRGAYLCAKAAVPHMRRNGGGRIINFADWVAASGRPRYLGYVPYFVAKRGVIALTEALALELAGGPDPCELHRPRSHPGAARNDRRGTVCRGTGHATRPVGRRERDREGRDVSGGNRLRDRRDHPRGRRAARQVTRRQRDGGGIPHDRPICQSAGSG